MQESATKLLTMIIIGRNDDYMGNFKYRITTSINFLAHQIEQLGRMQEIEILVTDWNSETPLSAILPLSPTAAQICRFIYVLPEIAAKHQPAAVRFHGAKATNTAIRRASGKFVMLFDADSLIPRHSLRSICDLLNGSEPVPYDIERSYFFCGRYQVPWEIVQRQPTLAELERYLVLNSGQLPLDGRPFGLGIFGIGLMMHRSLWHECRGYHEEMPGWGWVDAELAMRVTQRYPWIDLASIGVAIFHMEHNQRKRVTVSGSGGHKLNPYEVSLDFAANNENWGLGIEQLPNKFSTCFVTQAESELATSSTLQIWQQTRAELLDSLTANSVSEHVKAYLSSNRVPENEWGSFYALAWYALQKYPRTYLEFGARNPYATLIVAGACSGVEIYGVDSWQPDGRPAPPPSFITTALESIGYRGYVRFISGELNNSFERLQKSFIGSPRFDLIFVRGELFVQSNTESLTTFAQHLAPGGALVFTTSSINNFTKLFTEIRTNFPTHTFVQCNARLTGVMIAAKLAEQDSTIDLEKEEALLANAWNKIIFSSAQLAIWQRRFTSVWQQLRRQPMDKWPRTIQNRWVEFRKHWQVK